MDIVVLFMRVEDKFWGLFLVALFFFFLVWLSEKKVNYLFAAVYGTAAYALFLCPPVYHLVTGYIPALSGYYEMSHGQAMVPIMAMAGATALVFAYREGKEKAVYLAVGLFLLLCVAGDFVYLPAQEEGWSVECDKEEKEVLDLVLAHGKETDDDEKLRIWAMEDLMAKCRLYDSALVPVYGKNIGISPEKYSENQLMMYRAYDSYDTQTGTSANIDEQFAVMSGPPQQFGELDCEYVVLYDPKYQFEDYKKYFQEKDFDAVGYFCGFGYEFVGRTETMLVFYKQEG